MALAGCSSGAGGDIGRGDASAELACTHFRNVASDAASGILSYDEMRGKFQEVYNDAKHSQSAGIARDAQAMLADVTQVDTASFGTHLGAFAADCTAAGF
jgi:hypothetical protein